MLYADIGLILLVTAALICSVIAAVPQSFRDPPRDVLICAAHSDDCVILGAEYAYGAIRQGYSIRIVYLTCSGPESGAGISQVRRMEALAAWSALGVPGENLTFANLPQSPITGPISYSGDEIEGARQLFREVILSLPKNTAVIIPAEGESHVDHQTVREVCLESITHSKRKDLLIYETPEYNPVLSLVQCPQKTVRRLLTYLPFLGQLISPYAGSPNYVSGPRGMVFRDNGSRLAKKKELLTYFSSQGDRLVLNFGHRTPYRPIHGDILRRSHKRLYFAAFGRRCGWSVLALTAAVLVITFLTAHEFGSALTAMIPWAVPYLFFMALIFASAYLVRVMRQDTTIETLVFVWTAALGLISGVLK